MFQLQLAQKQANQMQTALSDDCTKARHLDDGVSSL